MVSYKSSAISLVKLIFEIGDTSVHLSTKPKKEKDLYLVETTIYSKKGDCIEDIIYDPKKEEFVNAPTLLLPYNIKEYLDYEKFRKHASKIYNGLISLGYISLDNLIKK